MCCPSIREPNAQGNLTAPMNFLRSAAELPTVRLTLLLDEAANAEKAGLVEVKRVQLPNYDFNTLNELAQLKHVLHLV
jgi:hypothetical protein